MKDFSQKISLSLEDMLFQVPEAILAHSFDLFFRIKNCVIITLNSLKLQSALTCFLSSSPKIGRSWITFRNHTKY